MKLDIRRRQIKYSPKLLYKITDRGVTYYFRNKRSAKKKRDEFGRKKRIELGPDHWRYKG